MSKTGLDDRFCDLARKEFIATLKEQIRNWPDGPSLLALEMEWTGEEADTWLKQEPTERSAKADPVLIVFYDAWKPGHRIEGSVGIRVGQYLESPQRAETELLDGTRGWVRETKPMPRKLNTFARSIVDQTLEILLGRIVR